jgi:hypothetical protein
VAFLARFAGRIRLRQGTAVLVLAAVTLTLAGPLLAPGAGADHPYCCRSGRCCCDSGKDSTEGAAFKATCRCARPDGSAGFFALPLGLLMPCATLSVPVAAEPVVPPLYPTPRAGVATVPEQPPRASPII